MKNTRFTFRELEKLTDIIHDKWFFIDDIEYKPETGILNLRIYCDNPYRSTSSHDGILSINHIKDVLIADTEKIGTYDVNKIIYDMQTSILSIKTNFPLDFRIIMNDISFEICWHKHERR